MEITMNWGVGSLGLFYMLSGLIIGWFQLANSLSSQEKRPSVKNANTSRILGYWQLVVGGFLFIIAFCIKDMSVAKTALIAVCMLIVNTMLVLFYVIAQNRSIN